MKTIPLTKGYVAKVDDSDFKWLSQWKWQANVVKNRVYAVRQTFDPVAYSQGRKCRGKVMMHRAILGSINALDGEHKNGDSLDNQRHNLRPATSSQNGLSFFRVSKQGTTMRVR